jgi:hypothetical protein
MNMPGGAYIICVWAEEGHSWGMLTVLPALSARAHAWLHAWAVGAMRLAALWAAGDSYGGQGGVHRKAK